MSDANPVEHSEEHWEACRSGEIGGLTQRLRARRRNRTLLQSGALAAVVLLACVAGWSMWAGGDAQSMACHEVIARARQYIAGELDVATTRKIEKHLETCVPCRRHINALRAETSIAVLADFAPLFASRNAPSIVLR